MSFSKEIFMHTRLVFGHAPCLIDPGFGHCFRALAGALGQGSKCIPSCAAMETAVCALHMALFGWSGGWFYLLIQR